MMGFVGTLARCGPLIVLLVAGALGVAGASDDPSPEQDPAPWLPDSFDAMSVNGHQIELWRGLGAHGLPTAEIRLTSRSGATVMLRDGLYRQDLPGDYWAIETLSHDGLVDVTGNGVPDLVIVACCGLDHRDNVYVVEMGDEPRVLVIGTVGILTGWGLIDLDGDGRYELIDAGGFRAFCEPTSTSVGVFAAAEYDAHVGAYRTDSALLLRGTPWLPASLDAVVDIALSGPPWLDVPGAGARMSDDCRLAHAVVPALASGAFAPSDVRAALARPEVVAAMPAVAELLEPIITAALEHPTSFVPTATPWQRVMSPEQLHALPCPLLLWLQGRLAADPSGSDVLQAARGVAGVNLDLVTAFSERIACDGPELTSLALRTGPATERCLRALEDRPAVIDRCDRIGTASYGVLVDVALTLVEQRVGTTAAREFEAAWLDEFRASVASGCLHQCAVVATRTLWTRSVAALLEHCDADDGALDRGEASVCCVSTDCRTNSRSDGVWTGATP